MRRITDTDKEIVKLITTRQQYGFTVPELFESLFTGTPYMRIRLDHRNPDGSPVFNFLLGYIDKESHNQDLIRSFNINNAINFLINESYIQVLQNNNFESFELNKAHVTRTNPVWVMNDGARQELFSKCFYRYQSTEELKKLHEHNYLTTTERTAISSRNTARVAIIISLIVAACAVYTIIFSNAFKPVPTTSRGNTCNRYSIYKNKRR